MPNQEVVLSIALDKRSQPIVEIEHDGRTWHCLLVEAARMDIAQRNDARLLYEQMAPLSAKMDTGELTTEEIGQLSKFITAMMPVVLRPLEHDCPFLDIVPLLDESDRLEIINLFGSRQRALAQSSAETPTGSKRSRRSKPSMAGISGNGG